MKLFSQRLFLIVCLLFVATTLWAQPDEPEREVSVTVNGQRMDPVYVDTYIREINPQNPDKRFYTLHYSTPQLVSKDSVHMVTELRFEKDLGGGYERHDLTINWGAFSFAKTHSVTELECIPLATLIKLRKQDIALDQLADPNIILSGFTQKGDDEFMRAPTNFGYGPSNPLKSFLCDNIVGDDINLTMKLGKKFVEPYYNYDLTKAGQRIGYPLDFSATFTISRPNEAIVEVEVDVKNALAVYIPR